MSSDFERNPWLWPISASLRMSAATLDAFGALSAIGVEPARRLEPAWTTPHSIVLDLPQLRLRQFGEGDGRPVVIVAPYAVHGPVLADLAPGHSLIARLLAEGLTRVVLVEWKSATPEMRFLRSDDYLALLLLVVDELGAPSTLVGLCQGGWLSLMFAARFPDKVSAVVLAGAPVDLDAAPSKIVTATRNAAPETFEALVQNDGLVSGPVLLTFWGKQDVEETAIADFLQVDAPAHDVIQRFHTWHAWTMDLPGAYYLQVVEDLFRRNKLAHGQFRALGRTLDLAAVRTPLLLIAAEQDDVAPPAQVFAARHLVGTRREGVATMLGRGGHLSLFMGARNLESVWRDAARWLAGALESCSIKLSGKHHHIRATRRRL
jgi:poly(3-hydroxyalkanoate) synthetase